MMMNAVTLFTEDSSNTVSWRAADSGEVHRVSEEVHVIESGTDIYLLGFEKYLRAGTFRGYIEVQIFKKGSEGNLTYIGAVEVKKATGDFQGFIEQARKEAFAMWCHNARQEKYDPVWVVLTDLEKVMRITYEGDNSLGATTSVLPGASAQAKPRKYYHRMPCTDVKGTITCTHTLSLFTHADDRLELSPVAPKALHAFVGGLLSTGDADYNLQVLQGRVKKSEKKVDELVEAAIEVGLRVAETREETARNLKRARDEDAPDET
eukprot:GHUV01017490.1.p1 GENE.GHUV01017490.1~~GHUV01017490.1.p1  ORF type:complete len:264 (+),score=57.36 GHUV01017490.1:588-1379(+)